MYSFNELCKLMQIYENSAGRDYSCLMLDLSFLQKEYKKLQDKICPCDIYNKEEKYGIEKEPHITIVYGLTIDKLNDLTDKIKFIRKNFYI